MYDWIITNKELLKIFYGLVLALVCLIIVLKTHKLFKLSLHQGIRYFRNAFFFYCLAFLSRYILGALNYYGYLADYSFLTKVLFEFFLVMGGFFLLYSLLWKKIEPFGADYDSSLFNAKILLFYFMTFIIVALDYLWVSYNFMIISQIIIFLSATAISYLNYARNGSRHQFLKFYFIAILLSLIAWILNSSLQYFDWSRGILINVYILNIIFFLLFLYGVIKLSSN